jgi:hypothetical protein
MDYREIGETLEIAKGAVGANPADADALIGLNRVLSETL